MGNNSDEDFLMGIMLGMLLCNGKKSDHNSGCLSVILAVLVVPALITWIAVAA